MTLRIDETISKPTLRWTVPIGLAGAGAALAVAEAVVIIASSVMAGYVYERAALGGVAEYDRFFAAGLMASVLFVLTGRLRGLYSPRTIVRFGPHIRDMFLIWVAVFSLLVGVGFALKIGSVFSRGSVAAFFVVGFAAVLGHRAIWSSGIRAALANDRVRRRPIALISAGAGEGDKVAEILRLNGLDPVARLDLSEADAGGLPQFIAAVRETKCCEIYVAANAAALDIVPHLLARVSVLPLTVRLVPTGTLGALLDSAALVTFSDGVAVEVKRAPLNWSELCAKRVLDVCVSAAALLLLAPLLITVALLVKLDSPGPALFRQRRLGFNGRTFSILKFRSMTVQDDGALVVQARRNDPRVTRVGRVLRRTSIDELPQLLNVLWGDMSLVGPRPHAIAHDTFYDVQISDYARRRNVKPGLTGWAQVNGSRGETPTLESMQARVNFDLWYVDHWSLWLDIRIMIATVMVLFKSDRAY